MITIEAEITARDLSLRTDRRKSSARAFFYSFFKRRRTQVRRDSDKNSNLYIDIHEPHIFILCASVIVLSACDAIFTLRIIENGGEEINPFMRHFLEIGVGTFFWVKYLLTSFGMLFLISHKNFSLFNLLRGYHILYGIFAMYFSLVSYELYLLSKIYS